MGLYDMYDMDDKEIGAMLRHPAAGGWPAGRTTHPRAMAAHLPHVSPSRPTVPWPLDPNPCSCGPRLNTHLPQAV